VSENGEHVRTQNGSSSEMKTLENAVRRVCSQKKFEFVKSLELIDTDNKKHLGEFELFASFKDPVPWDSVTTLRVELDKAVKEEFGPHKSAALFPGEEWMNAVRKINEKTGQEYIDACLADRKLIYSDDQS
jgi:hypothetical protein